MCMNFILLLLDCLKFINVPLLYGVVISSLHSLVDFLELNLEHINSRLVLFKTHGVRVVLSFEISSSLFHDNKFHLELLVSLLGNGSFLLGSFSQFLDSVVNSLISHIEHNSLSSPNEYDDVCIVTNVS